MIKNQKHEMDSQTKFFNRFDANDAVNAIPQKTLAATETPIHFIQDDKIETSFDNTHDTKSTAAYTINNYPISTGVTLASNLGMNASTIKNYSTLQGTDYADILSTKYHSTKVNSGAGNDYIFVNGGANSEIDAGTGNDHIIISDPQPNWTAPFGSGSYAHYIKTGEGSDTISISSTVINTKIRDFDPTKDTLDLSKLFADQTSFGQNIVIRDFSTPYRWGVEIDYTIRTAQGEEKTYTLVQLENVSSTQLHIGQNIILSDKPEFTNSHYLMNLDDVFAHGYSGQGQVIYETDFSSNVLPGNYSTGYGPGHIIADYDEMVNGYPTTNDSSSFVMQHGVVFASTILDQFDNPLTLAQYNQMSPGNMGVGIAPGANLIDSNWARAFDATFEHNALNELRQSNAKIVSGSSGHIFLDQDRNFDPARVAMFEQFNREGGISIIPAANGRANGESLFLNTISDNFVNHFAIHVGAISQEGTMTNYTNTGAFVGGYTSLPASAFYYNAQTQGYDPTVMYGSGTSHATPTVAGVAALMLQANANLTYRDVQHIFELTAKLPAMTGLRPVSNADDNYNYSWKLNGDTHWNGGGRAIHENYGFGLVDAAAAIRMAETWQSVGNQDNYATQNNLSVVALQDGSASILPPAGNGINIEWVDMTISLKNLNPANGLKVFIISPHGTTVQIGNILPLSHEDANEDHRFYDSNGTFTYKADVHLFWGENSVAYDTQGRIIPWHLVAQDANGNTVQIDAANTTATILGSASTNNDTYYFTDDYHTIISQVTAANDHRTIHDQNGGIDTINGAALSHENAMNINLGSSTMYIGADQVTLNGQFENVIAGAGDDKITGSTLNNNLYGSWGDDIIDGREGDDRIMGGQGHDILTGGAGKDTFVFMAHDFLVPLGNALIDNDNFDTIKDYKIGEDRLDVTDLIRAYNLDINDFHLQSAGKYVSELWIDISPTQHIKIAELDNTGGMLNLQTDANGNSFLTLIEPPRIVLKDIIETDDHVQGINDKDQCVMEAPKAELPSVHVDYVETALDQYDTQFDHAQIMAMHS